ncbi:MAG: KpsF/GutQ family sugar-phosphate isomerase [Fimbriimonadales bacterium]|jgi:arabinose-5-phosphate isomerase|nr:KpsF/GutQ family sugar-phosphate isomerase [Fimbriimonadales bacterium]GIV11739.1 MAG: arabinose-5-phosphate isomerase [Fimbriimonadales bacterium]CUU08592.1 arabinose-5-phosphate isomerase [Armatimonadetes bacterium GBS]CUU38241.1 arabinose-5-phosphate isomerase [Armatimonadetes bacterium GXS]
MSQILGERSVRAVAQEVLRIEAQAVEALAERIDESFERAVQVLLACSGRLVVSGVGKSGAIARKLAGTFSSTGTPALFLHPTEAAHGDLGTVTAQDVALLLSYSGESDELVALCPALKRLQVFTIAMTGRPDSTLGRMADLVLDVAVEREACPHNLAPTASTTAMLAMGDALALATMVARGFTPDDFALNHPAGALGRRLLLRAHDVMRTGEALAIVPQDAPLRDALFAITRAGAGAACVVDENGVMVGLVTDGDIRRRLLQDERALSQPVHEAMNRHFYRLQGNPLAIEVLEKFQSLPVKIGDMPVLDDTGRPIGMIALKDLLRIGIV